ncbi:MAG: hypothetical protein IPM16_12505 [Chloroflexi bacterium]|nr:hypothetical protein [Chloroflexota bacterium]
MSPIDTLLGAIFEHRRPGFYTEFEAWVRGSRRYRAFAETYQTKIRSKLRAARDADAVSDLYAELQAAALLLHEPKIALEYETYAATGKRGPDFSATWKAHTRFNVEVRRVRSVEWQNLDPEARQAKLTGILCDKAGQMPAGIVNVLWLAGDAGVSVDDVAGAAASLRGRAEGKEETFFARRGFRSAAEFIRHYRHVSAVVVREGGALAVWPNPLARHVMPGDLSRMIERLAAH